MAVNPDALSLVNLLDEVLRRVQAGFAEAGVDLPDRQFWKVGAPSADCEQLVVYFNQGYIGPPGDEAQDPQKCNSPRTAQLGVRIFRKVPALTGTSRGSLPSPEKIQEASRQRAIDAWVLLDISCSLDSWEEFPGTGGLGVIATVDSGEPIGDIQGVLLNLTVAIP